MVERETTTTQMNGQDVEGLRLGNEEMAIYKAQYPNAFVVPSSEMWDIYDRMKPFALALLQRGLKNWGGAFKGKHARGSEIGFSLIRPEHIDETEWAQTVTAAGWTDYYGSSASTKTMNRYSLVGIMGIANKSGTPIVEELRLNIDSKDFSPESLEELIFADNNNGKQMQPTAPYIIDQEIAWYMRVFNNANSGTDKTVFKGLTVGTGSYLNAETIT